MLWRLVDALICFYRRDEDKEREARRDGAVRRSMDYLLSDPSVSISSHQDERSKIVPPAAQHAELTSTEQGGGGRTPFLDPHSDNYRENGGKMMTDRDKMKRQSGAGGGVLARLSTVPLRCCDGRQ